MAKTIAALKAQFEGTDPADHNDDVLDAIEAVETGAAAAASTTAAGIVELATNAEALTGIDTARAVTPAALAAVTAGVKVISFDGINGAGACTLTGAVAGDKVIGVAGITAVGDAASSFEATITVNDQIQQTAVGDLSANDYLAVLLAVA